MIPMMRTYENGQYNQYKDPEIDPGMEPWFEPLRPAFLFDPPMKKFHDGEIFVMISISLDNQFQNIARRTS